MNNIDLNFNNENIGLFVVSIIIFGIIWYLTNNTQKQLTVNNYVVNTYIYILLALFICIVVMIVIGDFTTAQNILYNTNNFITIAISIVAILLLFAIVILDKEKYILRHILWVIFIICIAIVLFPIYDDARRTSILWKTIVSITLVVIALTYIASKYPVDYFNSWEPYLMVGLLGLIIFELLDFIFSDASDLYSRQKIYGLVGVVLFSGFILHDTNKIYQNATATLINCQEIKNQLVCADYPKESLSLFLDIINLFTSTIMLQK